MNFWNNFAAKHPAAAKWVREGGLFVIVSNLITVFKYLLLQFLPKAFASLPVVDIADNTTALLYNVLLQDNKGGDNSAVTRE